MKRHYSSGLLFALVGAAVAAAQHPSGAVDARHFSMAHRSQKATDLIGKNVVNSSNEDLGKIEEIVVDADSGRILYGVLSFGGFLGMGDKLFAVPWSSLDLPVEAKSFVLAVSKERLKAAEGFNKDRWPNFADQTWATKTHQFYERPPYWQASDVSTNEQTRNDANWNANQNQNGNQNRNANHNRNANQNYNANQNKNHNGNYAANDDQNPNTNYNDNHNSYSGHAGGTNRGVDNPQRDRWFKAATAWQKCSDLCGKDAHNLHDQDIGKISDCIIDPDSGRLIYGVLSSSGHEYAIPWAAMRLTADASKFQIDVTPEQLRSAPTLTGDTWTSVTDESWATNVHRYYKVDPYWLNSAGMPRRNP